MNTLPQLTDAEKVFVRNLVANCSAGEAFECAYPKDTSKVDLPTRDALGKKHANKTHIKAWVKFLRDAKPEDLINNVYLSEIAFGKPNEQLKAAEAFIHSNYAGKEVAHLFLETLQQIQAHILVPCGNHVDKVSI